MEEKNPNREFDISVKFKIAPLREEWLKEEEHYKTSDNNFPFIRYAMALIENELEFDSHDQLIKDGVFPCRYHYYKAQFKFLKDALQVFDEDSIIY